jgi:hypothetical protein
LDKKIYKYFYMIFKVSREKVTKSTSTYKIFTRKIYKVIFLFKHTIHPDIYN